MTVYELNMDGLVGPTHHYAGLSNGNKASSSNALTIANPALAAHQGIHKMRCLHQLGIKQALLPPHQRPNLHLLHQLGFRGTPIEQIQRANRADPALLTAAFSASSMWTANAATVSASIDTEDNRVHFTAANLISNLHRQQEADFSHDILTQLFSDQRYFAHHSPLPHSMITSDEGAANHFRLCKQHSNPGLNVFVYGKRTLPAGNLYPAPHLFPARQTLEAAQAIARNHQLNPQQVVFAHQNPKAIDQGVFHNDVIAVANESLLLLHEDAFLNQPSLLMELQQKSSVPLKIIEIKNNQISLSDAVDSYLFNSQLITLPQHPAKKNMALIAPIECLQTSHIKALLDEWIADDTTPLSEVHYLDLKQSMRNGGGPACLRLRILLSDKELAAMHPGVLVDFPLLDALDHWVDKHYRTHLHPDDLADPLLLNEIFIALDELTALLGLGSIYPFQRERHNHEILTLS
jgi:succinylarginine dihydrolase